MDISERVQGALPGVEMMNRALNHPKPAWVLLSALLGVLVEGCGGAAPLTRDFGPTPDVPGYGSTPALSEDELPLPWALRCSQVHDASPGPSWSGITIGVSTFEDLKQRLAPAEPQWHPNGYVGFACESDDCQGVEACFKGSIVSALLVTYGDYEYSTLDEWITAYGSPDLLTWSTVYDRRTLVWSEAGIAVEVAVDSAYATSLVLFSPIPQRKLDDSWVAASLVTEGPLGAATPLSPPYSEEDPWGIER